MVIVFVFVLATHTPSAIDRIGMLPSMSVSIAALRRCGRRGMMLSDCDDGASDVDGVERICSVI